MFKRRQEPEPVAVKTTPDEQAAKPIPPSKPVETQSTTATTNVRITAMIGASIKIKGEISGDENLIIDGSVEGRIDLGSHDLTIGNSGNVSANLTGKTIQIHGSVTGDIVGSELVLVSRTGCVLGNIVSPRVTLEDGAQFKGSIDMGPVDKKPSKPTNMNGMGTPSEVEGSLASRSEAVA